MRLKDNPSACVEPEYRNGRTCRECYFSQVNEKNQWTGTQRCWNAGCIVAETGETPTEKLRAMLDERGTEHFDYDANKQEGKPILETQWQTGDVHATYTEYPNKGHTTRLVVAWHPTPEQAIAATVGADYGIQFAPTLERPPETMVGESVFDGEGNAIGWIVNAAVGAGTCTMKPDGYLDEEYGIYVCSYCGEKWQFNHDGPKENRWEYCPRCRTRIEEVTE